VATEQSERIRAALLRAKASRQSSNTPTVESAEEPETVRTLTNFSETSASPVLKAGSVSPGPSLAALTEESENEAPLQEPLEDVETTLPLVAASEQDRAALFHDEVTSRGPSQLAPEEDAPPPRPRIDAGGALGVTRFPRNVLIVAGVLALVGISVFLLRNRLWPESKPSGGGSFPLQMQVESQGNGILNVRWNPQSAAVIQAREGRLAIAERDQQTRTIPLSPEQLKIGHLYYQSTVERVEFRMEIVDRSGGVAKESVLALSSGASTEPAVGPPVAPSLDQPSTQSAQTKKAPSVETQPESPRAAKTTEAAKTPQTEQPSRAPIRSFAPPPPSRAKTEETSAVFLDAPPVVPSGSVVPPPVSLPEAAVRIPAPQVKEPPAPPQPRLKAGGNLQAPKLVKRVTPVYPAAAQVAHIQGMVRFTATIGKDGTIQNVQVVSGPPLLIPAATEAVKKWVYQPMTLNGEPTEVVTQIEVNFALHQ
jgi:TonB family protein